jgi:TolA-binding protein
MTKPLILKSKRARLIGLFMSALVFVSVVSLPISLMTPSKAHAQLFDIGDDDNKGPKLPGIEWDKKRLERLDRNVRKLERAIQRIENKGPPPALVEPDPEVVALQATVDILSQKLEDQAAQITRLTGQIEEASFAASQARQDNQALMARLDTLTRRMDLNEATIKDINTAIAPPPPPPATTGSAEGDFDQAYSLLTNGNLEGAEQAFMAFTAKWPQAAQTGEAWYRLGQIRSNRGDISGSVGAFATSLKGWPKTSWAPDATVKLAAALSDTNRPKESCSALGEFNKRYNTLASASIKSQAKALSTKAKCN